MFHAFLFAEVIFIQQLFHEYHQSVKLEMMLMKHYAPNPLLVKKGS